MAKKFILLVSVLILALLALVACNGSASVGGNGNDNGPDKRITIRVENNEIEVGKEILLDKESNYKPFYQKDISYEVVGENTCGVTFRHSESNGWFNTYVSATAPGTAQVKLVHTTADGSKVESNVLTLIFTTNEITTAEELFDIKNSSDYYTLGADIDLTGKDVRLISGFKGILDGNGHKIIGLRIEATNETCLGLFSTLEGTVKNLTLENCEVSAAGMSEKIGILAGENKGTVENVVISGSVNAKYFSCVGGIVGYNDGGVIKGCTSNVTVLGDAKVGGIVGCCYVNGAEGLSNNTNNGTVTGSEQVGGIAGVLTAKNVDGTHLQTLLVNTADIVGETKVGGIIGDVYGSRFVHKGSYVYNYFELSLLNNSGSVTAEEDYAGGFIGNANQLKLISASTNTAPTVTGANYVGGFIGYGNGTEINAGESPNTTTVVGRTYVGGFAGYAGRIEDAVNNGTVTATSISDGKTYLGGIAGYCTGAVDCRNTTDIVSSGGGKYVGGVAGYLELKGTENCNKNYNTAAISGNDYTGGIFGAMVTESAGGTYAFTNMENTGAVSGGEYVGGIAGYVYGSKYTSGGNIRNNVVEATILTNRGTVTASGNYVGGIYGCGESVSVINTTANHADITGASYVGGLVGRSEKTVIYAMENENVNVISGNSYVGGFAGYTGSVKDAINKGSIIIRESVVVDGDTIVFAGGIAGFCQSVIDCVNESNISVTTGGYYVGGIAGYVLTLDENSVSGNKNSGNISGEYCVGGIVGFFQAKSAGGTYNLKNCENSGNISGITLVGGIAGYANGSQYTDGGNIRKNSVEISYCTNTGTVSGVNYAGGILGNCGSYFGTELFGTNTDSSGKPLGTPL